MVTMYRILLHGQSRRWKYGILLRSFSSGSKQRHEMTLLEKLNQPIQTAYHPQEVEAGWQQWWDERRSSSASDERSPKKNRPFSMILPPPNVTGALHLGHALTITIQDALARWHRMQGHDVRWIPGLDHAGIATQTIVEKHLLRETGQTRHDLGRAQFLDRVWKWYGDYGNRISGQLKRLGASLDWHDEFFTLDDARSKAVTLAFVELHRRGLIYRSKRMIHWCPALQTALSDIEVDPVVVDGPTYLSVPGSLAKVEFGVMYRLKYELIQEESPGAPSEYLLVDTTRPETILGDVALAIHPQDSRYRHYHGAFVRHPFSRARMPILCDAELVNMELGTGVVKVTPGHDARDYACTLRHLSKMPDIPIIIDRRGYMDCQEMLPEVHGRPRFEARRVILDTLERRGLFVEKLDHATTVHCCSRSGDVIEPTLLPQWFVQCQDLAQKANALVTNEELELEPSQLHEITWHRWLEKTQDWCISRQLWWGHRIPAYRPVGMPDAEWIIAPTKSEALVLAQRRFPDVREMEQDTDVLDTWFSSALLPYTAFLESDQVDGQSFTQEHNPHYPLSIMETGHDILFFWVARMAMLCQELTGTPPFEKVWLHPVIRDKSGRKMSKSLGNVIDPVHVIEGMPLQNLLENVLCGNLDPREVKVAQRDLTQEFPQGIPECGTDALRFTLSSYLQQGRQINMDLQRVVSYRHFCNKIWNAYRFMLPHLPPRGDSSCPTILRSELEQHPSLGLAEHWILSRLDKTVSEINAGLHDFQLASSTTALYSFFVHDFCDVYVELSKARLSAGANSEDQVATVNVLEYCFDTTLRLLHPFMPFISEELWQRLYAVGLRHSIQDMEYPAVERIDQLDATTIHKSMELVLGIVHQFRSLNHTLKTLCRQNHLPNTSAGVIICCTDEKERRLILDHVSDIEAQCRAGSIEIVSAIESEKGMLVGTMTKSCKVLLPLRYDGETLARLEQEIKRLVKRQSKQQKIQDQMREKLKSPKYLAHAPAQVVAQDQGRLEKAERELQTIHENVSRFQELQRHLLQDVC